MKKPLGKYNVENNTVIDDTVDGLVWGGIVDRRYISEVQRVTNQIGQLLVFDTRTLNEIIHQQEVNLSYGAQFGPDMADIEEWKDMVLQVIDRG
jgi:hypothetical protein